MWAFRRLSIWSEPRKLRLRSFSVSRRDQMNSHKNAPLTPKGREAMVRFVEAGLSKTAAACQFNTTPKTVAKWVERFRAGGVDGLRDRSSRPLSLPSQTAPGSRLADDHAGRVRAPFPANRRSGRSNYRSRDVIHSHRLRTNWTRTGGNPVAIGSFAFSDSMLSA